MFIYGHRKILFNSCKIHLDLHISSFSSLWQWEYLQGKKHFLIQTQLRSSALRCSVKKLFLEILQNSQKNTCVRVFFKKMFQVSGEIYKNIFFIEHLRKAASVRLNMIFVRLAGKGLDFGKLTHFMPLVSFYPPWKH